MVATFSCHFLRHMWCLPSSCAIFAITTCLFRLQFSFSPAPWRVFYYGHQILSRRVPMTCKIHRMLRTRARVATFVFRFKSIYCVKILTQKMKDSLRVASIPNPTAAVDSDDERSSIRKSVATLAKFPPHRPQICHVGVKRLRRTPNFQIRSNSSWNLVPKRRTTSLGCCNVVQCLIELSTVLDLGSLSIKGLEFRLYMLRKLFTRLTHGNFFKSAIVCTPRSQRIAFVCIPTPGILCEGSVVQWSSLLHHWASRFG